MLAVQVLQINLNKVVLTSAIFYKKNRHFPQINRKYPLQTILENSFQEALKKKKETI